MRETDFDRNKTDLAPALPETKRSPRSPLAVNLFVFLLMVSAMAGGLVIWKQMAKQQVLPPNESSALSAYRIDPATGELTKVNARQAATWPENGVEEFSLIERSGATITKDDLLGKPWAVCFVFTRCAGPCLNVMSGMRQIQRELEGSDVRLVTISVEPKYDTPEVLAPYADGFEADPNRWLFLTGERDEIYQLIQKSFLLPVREVTGPDRREGDQVVHATEILHVNAAGRVVGKYNGLDEAQRMKLVRAMKKEAAELKTSSQAGKSPSLSSLSNFELTERSGNKVTKQDLLGQPWAVCFVFTRCAGQCLDITAKMANLQRELKGAPVRLVTITVDPNYDTTQVLGNYADGFGADPKGWLFLTGDRDYVYTLLRGSFRQLVHEFTGKDRVKGWEVLHSSDVLHVNAEGRIVKRYNGLDDADMTRLRRALLAEAEQLAERPAEISTGKPAVAEKLPAPETDEGN